MNRELQNSAGLPLGKNLFASNMKLGVTQKRSAAFGVGVSL